MKLLKLLLISAFFIFSNSYTYGTYKPKEIKIAILDNFHFQPNISSEYDQFYLRGIEIAQHAAFKKGYHIIYKVFRYSRDPLAILNEVSKIEKWAPDVIIGPRNSNMFLLIKNSFKNILVLSPFATSSEVRKMPKNYYSLTLPDNYTASVILKYIYKYNPKSAIYSIVEADCKNCMDINKELKLLAGAKNIKYSDFFYLQKSAHLIDLTKPLKDIKPNDIIILPNTSYSSAVLMLRITNYLKKSISFIGGDDWGALNNTETAKLRASYTYYGIHATPWSMDAPTLMRKILLENYSEMNIVKPINAASLLGFTTVMSFIDALEKFSHSCSDMKVCILNSYLKALKNNSNWYRPTTYVLYKRNENHEYPIDTIKLDRVNKDE